MILVAALRTMNMVKVFEVMIFRFDSFLRKVLPLFNKNSFSDQKNAN